MIGSVNTDNTEEIMPDTTTPGDQLEAKSEVAAQSSGNETDHSTSDSDDNEPTPSDSKEFYAPEVIMVFFMILFYVIIKGSVTDDNDVQQKSSDGKSIFKIILVIILHPNILDDVVNDVAETEDQEMGSGMSHKTDDEGTNICYN